MLNAGDTKSSLYCIATNILQVKWAANELISIHQFFNQRLPRGLAWVRGFKKCWSSLILNVDPDN